MLLDQAVFSVDNRDFALNIFPEQQRRLQHLLQAREAVSRALGGDLEKKALWRAVVEAFTFPARRCTQPISRSSLR